MNVKKTINIFIVAILVMLSFQPTQILAKEWTYQTSDDVNKVWSVRFSTQMDSKSMIPSNIYITDGQNVHPTTLSMASNGSVVKVKPTKPFSIGKNYQLIVKKDVQSKSGKALKTAIEVPFQILDPSIKIQHIESFTNSFFTTITVRTSSDTYKVTVDGVEMDYKGGNVYSHTVIDEKPGSSITIYAYDVNNKRIETKKYTIPVSDSN